MKTRSYLEADQLVLQFRTYVGGGIRPYLRHVSAAKIGKGVVVQHLEGDACRLIVPVVVGPAR